MTGSRVNARSPKFTVRHDRPRPVGVASLGWTQMMLEGTLAGRENCVRCFTPTRATVVGAFAYEGREYDMPLCDPHARMFDQEMLSWARVGRELKVSVGARSSNNSPIPFPVSKGGEVFVETPISRYTQDEIAPEVISSWSFSDAAKQWIQRRGLTNADVLWVVAANDKKDEPGTAEDVRFYTLGELVVTVDTIRRRVLNVAQREKK